MKTLTDLKAEFDALPLDDVDLNLRIVQLLEQIEENTRPKV